MGTGVDRIDVHESYICSGSGCDGGVCVVTIRVVSSLVLSIDRLKRGDKDERGYVAEDLMEVQKSTVYYSTPPVTLVLVD